MMLECLFGFAVLLKVADNALASHRADAGRLGEAISLAHFYTGHSTAAGHLHSIGWLLLVGARITR